MRYAAVTLSLFLPCLTYGATNYIGNFYGDASGTSNTTTYADVVRDYGADPNWGADNAAIQAALDSCREVYMPTGVYYATSLVLTNQGQILRGAGQHNTILRFDGAPITGGILVSNSRCLIKDLSVYGYGPNTNLIRIGNTGPITTVQNVDLEYVGGDGLYVAGAFSVTVDNVQVEVANRGIAADGYYQNLHIKGCAPLLCTNAGIYLGPGGSSGGVVIDGNTEIDNQASGAPGLFVDAPNPVRILNCYTEAAYGGPSILLTNTSTVLLQNVYANGTSYAGEALVKCATGWAGTLNVSGANDIFGFTNAFKNLGTGIIQQDPLVRVSTNSPATNTIVRWGQINYGGTNYFVPLCQ